MTIDHSTFAQHFRANTWDENIFNSVAIANEYNLLNSLAGQVVIDIGAHIGSFTYAAIARGAKKVYAVEADLANFTIASLNLAEWIEAGIVDLAYGAVWRSDDNGDELYHEGYSEGHVLGMNTGAGGVINGKGGNSPLPKIPFDDLVMRAKGMGRIDLLKIDCEGSEWPILLTSQKLGWINAIVGEVHEFNGNYDSLIFPYLIRGWSRFTLPRLAAYLDDQGFFCEYAQLMDERGQLCRLGKIKGERRY